ncbi:MAG: hypothetical protein FD180_133 [Planctomycetota bacterium]|nr:MAG: hypothetical protein FD180_133 [Planctomycetota bacterium]
MFRPVLLTVLLALAARADNPDAGKPEGDGWKSADLAYAPCPRNFPFTCFDGAATPVSGASIALPTKSGSGVAVFPTDFAIGVDTFGDGKQHEKLTSDGATAQFMLTYADGFSAPYLARFFRKIQKKTWNFERAGYWKGSVGGEAIALIDQNNDGMYDGYGNDAVAVGTTVYATPLSKVVVLGGALNELRVAPSGRRLWVRPYKGETGKIDAVTGYKTQGKLLAAVFRSGDLAFNVVGKDKAFALPAGRYELVGGEVGASAGGQKAEMRKGTMPALEVTSGGTATAAWGMDLKITFACSLDKGVLAMKGLDVHAYGSGGEEYVNISPVKLTPEITVWSGSSPKPVLTGNLSICPQGSIDDWKSAVAGAAGTLKVQLVEKKFVKMFGVFQSEVVQK